MDLLPTLTNNRACCSWPCGLLNCYRAKSTCNTQVENICR